MSLGLVDRNASGVETHPAARAAIRVGMPHLDYSGLSQVSQDWLLRECCNRQWWAVAESAGKTPSELTDCRGARLFASVVAETVRGPFHPLRQDDPASVDRLVAPTHEIGWRSAWLARSGRGAVVSGELLTVFAKRASVSNTELGIADLRHESLPDFDGVDCERARVLRARGRLESVSFPTPAVPQFSLLVLAHAHYNGLGMMYFSNFIAPSEHIERIAMAESFENCRHASHQIHYFGNVSADDWLGLDFSPGISAIAPDAEIVSTSIARHRCDDSVVALCISARQATHPGGGS